MRGPLSADRLFFISSLCFVISFILYTALNYLWPLPTDAVAAVSNGPSNALNSISWMLSIGGVVTFILGFLARRQ